MSDSEFVRRHKIVQRAGLVVLDDHPLTEQERLQVWSGIDVLLARLQERVKPSVSPPGSIAQRIIRKVTRR